MEDASLEHTPTWVVAAVCFTIVSVSLAAERFLHYLGKALKHKKQKTLFSALQRLKEELMLLGFISFVLSLSQGFIVHICIPETATRFMLPCKRENHKVAEKGGIVCKKKGDVPLLSLEALHQLHIFIFVLGFVHVVFCATTILLGGAKIRKWKHWETRIHREIQQKFAVQQTEHPGKVTPPHVLLHREYQGEFVTDRTKGFWTKLAVVSWIIAFLKQFHDSVSKSDYVALRSAFVLIHYPRRPDFDFHKYMTRALEHDFKRVVGIRMAYILLVSFPASVSPACCWRKATAHHYSVSSRGSSIASRRNEPSPENKAIQGALLVWQTFDCPSYYPFHPVPERLRDWFLLLGLGNIRVQFVHHGAEGLRHFETCYWFDHPSGVQLHHPAVVRHRHSHGRRHQAGGARLGPARVRGELGHGRPEEGPLRHEPPELAHR
ncbi:MLO-like protein 13 isoform X3 [Lolium perenne]|uniref:MLO-like protein 13 isoform X3 n=1 Tax=Lolium perenne TaxID=4522 RepID=UPI0021F6517F|nr:MLO-like protein 13 isoform X3 [Lolium perenne]